MLYGDGRPSRYSVARITGQERPGQSDWDTDVHSIEGVLAELLHLYRIRFPETDMTTVSVR